MGVESHAFPPRLMQVECSPRKALQIFYLSCTRLAPMQAIGVKSREGAMYRHLIISFSHRRTGIEWCSDRNATGMPMDSCLTLPVRRAPSGGRRGRLCRASGPTHRGVLLLLMIALSLFAAQGIGQRPCLTMPLQDCMMTTGTETAASSATKDQKPPCCPLQQMANCTGAACAGPYIAAPLAMGFDMPLDVRRHGLPRFRSEQARSRIDNIFHPPRTSLS